MAKREDGDSYESMEPLRRKPLPVTENTDEDELAGEMAERLAALLLSHGGLEPTAEGWRQLALELALKYEPAFQIETPVERTGRSGIGGRPPSWESFGLRIRMKREMRKGKTNSEAARAINKETRGGIPFKTAQNALSREAEAPDLLRRLKYQWKAQRAIKSAAKKLSQQ